MSHRNQTLGLPGETYAIPINNHSIFGSNQWLLKLAQPIVIKLLYYVVTDKHIIRRSEAKRATSYFFYKKKYDELFPPKSNSDGNGYFRLWSKPKLTREMASAHIRNQPTYRNTEGDRKRLAKYNTMMF